MIKAGNYKIYFRHNNSSKNAAPKKTTCTIKRDDNIIAEASAKPLSEIPVVIKDKEHIDTLGKKVKRVYTLDDKTKVAILSGDKFSYSEGRKKAFTKALRLANIHRDDRKILWAAYKKECKYRKKA
jgi:hypothetical protein